MRRRPDMQLSRQNSQLLAAIVSSSDDAIIGKNIDGVITSWNRGAQRIFGYTAEEVVGRSISVLAAPGREDEMPKILQRLRRGERIEHFETSRRHKDGSIVLVSLTVSPILDDEGRVIGASKVARDVTAARRAQEALTAAEERLEAKNNELLHAARLSELGQMAATLAHEINQPLTATLSYLQGVQRLLLNDASPTAERITAAINAAADQTLRSAEIVRRLKTFARPGAAPLTSDTLDDAVREAVHLAAIDARTSDVTIEMEVTSAPTRVLIDRVEIQQVVLNLLRNAIEAVAGQEDKEVRLSIHRLRDSVEVCVADNGHGISAEVRDRVFDAFVSTKDTGLGLGLAICQKIIARHNGVMKAAARAPRGAEFCFSLPVESRPEAPHLVLVRSGG